MLFNIVKVFKAVKNQLPIKAKGGTLVGLGRTNDWKIRRSSLVNTTKTVSKPEKPNLVIT